LFFLGLREKGAVRFKAVRVTGKKKRKREGGNG